MVAWIYNEGKRRIAEWAALSHKKTGDYSPAFRSVV